MAAKQYNRWFIGAITVLSFLNEFTGLIGHSGIPGTDFLITWPVFKIVVDLVSVSCCAMQGIVHSKSKEIAPTMLAAMTPIVAAFVVPTLVMRSVLSDFTKRRYKIGMGLFVILSLASLEGVISRLQRMEQWEATAVGYAVLLSLLLPSLGIYALTPHDSHTHSTSAKTSPALAVSLIGFLICIAAARFTVWETVLSSCSPGEFTCIGWQIDIVIAVLLIVFILGKFIKDFMGETRVRS